MTKKISKNILISKEYIKTLSNIKEQIKKAQGTKIVIEIKELESELEKKEALQMLEKSMQKKKLK